MAHAAAKKYHAFVPHGLKKARGTAASAMILPPQAAKTECSASASSSVSSLSAEDCGEVAAAGACATCGLLVTLSTSSRTWLTCW